MNVSDQVGDISVASEFFAKLNHKNFDAVITISSTRAVPFIIPESSAKQLVLTFDDAEGFGGAKLASLDHINQAIDFAREVRDQSLLVHCGAGERRSPAVALAIIADRLGPGCEKEAVDYLYSNFSDIEPNARIVEIADMALGRDGVLAGCFYSYKDLHAERLSYEAHRRSKRLRWR